MGPDGEVRVEPERLRAGARACVDLRDSLGRSVADVEPETVAAEKALPGWLTQKALRELLWAWRDDLTKLGKRMGAVADALDACARDYETADHASASHFWYVERPW